MLAAVPSVHLLHAAMWHFWEISKFLRNPRHELANSLPWEERLGVSWGDPGVVVDILEAS